MSPPMADMPEPMPHDLLSLLLSLVAVSDAWVVALAVIVAESPTALVALTR